jgi:hypothetical protein
MAGRPKSSRTPEVDSLSQFEPSQPEALARLQEPPTFSLTFADVYLLALLRIGTQEHIQLSAVRRPQHGIGLVACEKSSQLRHVWFSNRKSFWEIRPKYRDAVRREDGFVTCLADGAVRSVRIPRSRRDKTLPPPCWHGEARPAGYRTIKLKPAWEASCKMIRNLANLGFPRHSLFDSFLGAPTFASKPDRRNGRSCGTSDYPAAYSSRCAVHPEHPYRPAAPIVRLRQARAEQISHQKFSEVIVTMRGSQSVQSERALYEICVVGRKVGDVAAERGLSPAALGKAAQRMRQKAAVNAVEHWSYESDEQICA